MPDRPHVRPLTEADMARLLEIDNIAFLEAPPSAERVAWERRFLETDRSIGLFDRDEQVGGASIFTLRLTVPDARQVPMAGVTWVSVLPTHRRRGGLTAMMRHQLHTLHATGAEPVAGLMASQPPIYGRFGYGLASRSLSFRVPRHANALRLPAGAEDVSLRIVDPASTDAYRAQLCERQVLARPGTLAKSAVQHEFDVADTPEMRDGGSALRCVLAERHGSPVGFALYRTVAGSVRCTNVKLIQAEDVAAYAALWQMLLNIDLVTEIHSPSLGIPLDDPLLHLLEDARAADPVVRDGLYVRLVDVDRSLVARTYSTPIDLVLEVEDEFCPWNAGRWRLAGDETGATCVRTEAAADLSIDVRDLGAAYLGGIKLRSLDLAGLITEHTKGALRAASQAFATDIEPWLSVGF